MYRLGNKSWKKTVHPHSRGENRPGPVSINHSFGSSPLARGKCVLPRTPVFEPGFIPTRAGKMVGTRCRMRRFTVHPHSRGENPSIHPKTRPCNGSSPLARGKLQPRSRPSSSSGFIPTRAGKMISSPKSVLMARVHPHSRGENMIWPWVGIGLTGSSPLARGKWW